MQSLDILEQPIRSISLHGSPVAISIVNTKVRLRHGVEAYLTSASPYANANQSLGSLPSSSLDLMWICATYNC
jgi:hypothetical protein